MRKKIKKRKKIVLLSKMTDVEILTEKVKSFIFNNNGVISYQVFYQLFYKKFA